MGRVRGINNGNRLKTLVACLISVSCASAVYGQAFTPFVDFNNHSTYQMAADRDVYAPDGITPLVGTQYMAQLYYGIDEGSLQPVTAAPARFRDPAEIAMNPILAGTWRGGTRVLTGFAAGQVATLQVRAWDSTGGATWENASWRGQSAPFTYHVPPAGPGFFEYIEGFRSFALVPEPEVLGLSAIGAGVLLLLFRRRSRAA